MSTYNQTKAAQKAWEYRHYGKHPQLDTLLNNWWNSRLDEMQSKGVRVEPGFSNGEEAWRLTNCTTGRSVVVPKSEVEADFRRIVLGQQVTA